MSASGVQQILYFKLEKVHQVQSKLFQLL